MITRFSQLFDILTYLPVKFYFDEKNLDDFKNFIPKHIYIYAIKIDKFDLIRFALKSYFDRGICTFNFID